MKTGTSTHPKFVYLCSLIGLKKWEAVGILESLWEFASQYTPQGNIGKWTDAQISSFIEYPQDKILELMAALSNSGWIDPDEENRFIIHDWGDHAPHFIKERLRRQGLEILVAKNASTLAQRASMLAKIAHKPNPTQPNQTQPKPTKSRQPEIPIKELQLIADKWNVFAAQEGFPKALKLTPDRIKHLRDRLADGTAELLDRVFEKLKASEFCHGNNDRRWRPDFDWLIRSSDSAIKALEGKYDKRIDPIRDTNARLPGEQPI